VQQPVRQLGTQIRSALATPATKPKGSQFVLHAKALHRNFFDGHTLRP
jgi:IS5 family transposase